MSATGRVPDAAPVRCRSASSSPRAGSSSTRGWSGPDAWARSVELARLAESLGYDHLWVYDHVETVPRREPTHVFEAYTMLAALSQRTTRVGLGQLVTCASYRNAGLLAKEAACIDVYSGGRLILGLGAGWFHEEYHSYGYEYLSDRERLAVLDETLEVVRRLWTRGDRHLRRRPTCTSTAPTATPSRSSSCRRCWWAAGGEQVNLRIAARRADLTNWQVGLEAFVRKSGLLAGYCEEVGRPFEDINRTHGPDCRLFDTEADTLAWCESEGGGDLWGGTPTERYLADNLVGTVDQVIEKTQAFVDAGCRGLILWLRDFPGDETLRRFMAEVVPALKVPSGR